MILTLTRISRVLGQRVTEGYSGAGLSYLHNGSHYLTGVVSVSDPWTDDSVVVFTNISYHVRWIADLYANRTATQRPEVQGFWCNPLGHFKRANKSTYLLFHISLREMLVDLTPVRRRNDRVKIGNNRVLEGNEPLLSDVKQCV